MWWALKDFYTPSQYIEVGYDLCIHFNEFPNFQHLGSTMLWRVATLFETTVGWKLPRFCPTSLATTPQWVHVRRAGTVRWNSGKRGKWRNSVRSKCWSVNLSIVTICYHDFAVILHKRLSCTINADWNAEFNLWKHKFISKPIYLILVDTCSMIHCPVHVKFARYVL